MTVEDLSVATAERYENKMLHDVKNTAHVRAPPRPDPPIFGRESMEDAISARAAVVTGAEEYRDDERSPEPPKASAKAATIEDEVTAFFAVFQRIESRLHLHLTDDDKKRIRNALTGPTEPILQRITSDPATNTLVISVLLTGVVLYVCNSSRRPYIRTPYRGESRSELMSWNIGRLLKPFSHPH